MAATQLARRTTLALCLALAAGVTALGQGGKNPNEKDIKPAPNALDPDEIYDKEGNPKADSKLWVLDFRFKPLRSVKVNIPGRGEQVCWYLWYQVTNKTSQPQRFVPDFELVTHDTRMPALKDELLPLVQEKIAEIEDPSKVLDIKNSVTITRQPIPAAKANSIPRPVTGVAIWSDPNEPLPRDTAEEKEKKAKMPKLIESNFFSIFIAGLSNGWSEAQAVGGDRETVVRRKTLQLKFRRYGDGTLRRDEDVRFENHEWLYRASNLVVPKSEKPKDGDKPPMPPKP